MSLSFHCNPNKMLNSFETWGESHRITIHVRHFLGIPVPLPSVEVPQDGCRPWCASWLSSPRSPCNWPLGGNPHEKWRFIAGKMGKRWGKSSINQGGDRDNYQWRFRLFSAGTIIERNLGGVSCRNFSIGGYGKNAELELPLTFL